MDCVTPAGDSTKIAVVGEEQGFRGLPLRHDHEDVELAGTIIKDQCVLTTYWKPSEEEKEKIAAGKSIVIRIWSPLHPPITVEMVDRGIS